MMENRRWVARLIMPVRYSLRAWRCRVITMGEPQRGRKIKTMLGLVLLAFAYSGEDHRPKSEIELPRRRGAESYLLRKTSASPRLCGENQGFLIQA